MWKGFCTQSAIPTPMAWSTGRPKLRERAAREPRGAGEGSSHIPSSISLLISRLHSHHDLIQRFPFQVGHCGLFAGVPHRQQHQQLLVCGAAQEHPQTGATVERSGSDSHQACVLKRERKRVRGNVSSKVWLCFKAGDSPAPVRPACSFPEDGQQRGTGVSFPLALFFQSPPSLSQDVLELPLRVQHNPSLCHLSRWGLWEISLSFLANQDLHSDALWNARGQQTQH